MLLRLSVALSVGGSRWGNPPPLPLRYSWGQLFVIRVGSMLRRFLISSPGADAVLKTPNYPNLQSVTQASSLFHNNKKNFSIYKK
jgi:hypothetical protein